MEKVRRHARATDLHNYYLALLVLCVLSLLCFCFNDISVENPSMLESIMLNSLAASKGSWRQQNNWKLTTQTPSSTTMTQAYQTENGDGITTANSRVAGLNCETFGGPPLQQASEMVYWEDIPSDSQFVSPFRKKGVRKYLTFVPDPAGWNNVRMGLETVIALSFAMGRTLVLPPKPETSDSGGDENHSSTFSFANIFPLESVANEHSGFEIITMKEFLQREAIEGNVHDKSGTVVFPPDNRTNWDWSRDKIVLHRWLERVSHMPPWNPAGCLAAFPRSTNPSDIQALQNMKSIVDQDGGFPNHTQYIGKPNPVNASTIERMKENWAQNWAGSKKFCLYDEEMQNHQILHFPHNRSIPGGRLLVHFYAFLFFQDWRHDLWMKRFVRDHIRYADSIQCAAARIVHAIRERSRARGDPNGDYDSFHIRRGDFAYFAEEAVFDANQIFEISKGVIVENSTVYVATDEKDGGYFKPLRNHYDVVFIHHFMDELVGVDTRYYALIEQLVLSRSRFFFGCFWSTFSGYVNRLRGYHANKVRALGYEQGIINSWYYAPKAKFNEMRSYVPVFQDYYEREFPTSWRLINEGIGEVQDGRIE